jgi:hypothetical protein
MASLVEKSPGSRATCSELPICKRSRVNTENLQEVSLHRVLAEPSDLLERLLGLLVTKDDQAGPELLGHGLDGRLEAGAAALLA